MIIYASKKAQKAGELDVVLDKSFNMMRKGEQDLDSLYEIPL